MPYLISGHTRHVLQKRTLIGRAAHCDIVLEESTQKRGVSREHLEVYPTPEGWMLKAVTDKENTTYRVTSNGREALEPGECVLLQDNDDIYAGMVKMTFREDGSASCRERV